MKFAEAYSFAIRALDRNCDFIHSDLIILLVRRKCLDGSVVGVRAVRPILTAAIQFMIGFHEMEKERE